MLYVLILVLTKPKRREDIIGIFGPADQKENGKGTEIKQICEIFKRSLDLQNK